MRYTPEDSSPSPAPVKGPILTVPRTLFDPLSLSVTSSAGCPHSSDTEVIHAVAQCDAFAVPRPLAYGDIDSPRRWIAHPCAGRVAAARAVQNVFEKQQLSFYTRPPWDWADHLCLIPSSVCLVSAGEGIRENSMRLCVAYTEQ